jgi:hypothetical protein
MTFPPYAFESQNEVRTRVRDDKDLVILSGYALLAFQHAPADPPIKREDIQFVVGPAWRNIESVAPTMALASVFNDGPVNNPGWAVDNCRWAVLNDRIQLAY